MGTQPMGTQVQTSQPGLHYQQQQQQLNQQQQLQDHHSCPLHFQHN